MINFVIGLLFIIVNFYFKLPFIPGKLEILPSFIGYAFIFRGILKHKEECPELNDIKALSLVMVFYELSVFILNILGVQYQSLNKVTMLADSIIFQRLLPLFITYKIIWGIISIAEKRDTKIEDEKIKMLYLYAILISVVTFFITDTTLSLLLDIGLALVNISWFYFLYKACETCPNTD